MNLQLTKNFNLSEFLISETAERHGIKIEPNFLIVSNLTRLCCLILQPLRDFLKTPITVLSGFRPLEINRLIGSTNASQHITGQAADIVVYGKKIRELIQIICNLGLPYDQLIDEFDSWLHVSVNFAEQTPRQQLMKATREENKIVYKMLNIKHV